MSERDVILVPLTKNEIKRLRALLLQNRTDTGTIPEDERQRLVIKFHAALEGISPLTLTTDFIQ